MSKPLDSLIDARDLARVEERIAAARSEDAASWTRIDQEPRIAETLTLVLTCSEFVAATCLSTPRLLAELAAGELFEPLEPAQIRRALRAIADPAGDDAELLANLRQFRRMQLVRIAWRDLAGWADLNETLSELSDLADACIEYAHERAYLELTRRYGMPHGERSGAPQELAILGMGKLGGRELNFSSDIDLVFLYPEDGETRAEAEGQRPIENAEFFLRLAQRIIHLLAAKTDAGFVYRVDMRLRPFGDSGRMAISFDSFEHYLQNHGRDWERYAYVKARPIVSSAAGAAMHAQLYENVIRPFVYRRYLDFGVFDSLREMKALIAREVERRELKDNVKLGPGGIREIEFIVQAFQLIRGGSDRRLQTRELRTALTLLAGAKLLPQSAVKELDIAYAFLRRLENRLQEFNDEQTHKLPSAEPARQRLALAMNHSDWRTLEAEIENQRATVMRHFNAIVFGPADREAGSVANTFDVDASEEVLKRQLSEMLVPEADQIASQLQLFADSGYYRRLDETGQRRVNHLMPRMLRMLPESAATTLARLLRIIEMIGGRTVYLALLGENDTALRRLVDLCARSGFLAEQIATLPLLLDELIDTRLFESAPSRDEFAAELAVRMESARHEDTERQIEALCQFQRAAMFRIAIADLYGHLPLMKVSDRLTELAELIVAEALRMAWAQIVERHGTPQCGPSATELRTAEVVVVGYGKFGGIELGYGSDLDLVFLHDSAGEVQLTTGPQRVENTVFFARLGQRLVHLLTTHTRAGRLYEVDIRLRPSGKGGLLVQTLSAFTEYQRKEAWTWEHQALLRARAVAGSSELCAIFEALRVDLLRTAVRRDSLRTEVREMRERMRRELSRAKPGQFDLKQDAGGIADLEFLTQYWVLKWCDQYPPIATFSDNIRQLESLASGAIVPQDTVDFLTATYRKYRQRMHHLSLEGGDDVIGAEEFVEERRELIELWNKEMGGAASN